MSAHTDQKQLAEGRGDAKKGIEKSREEGAEFIFFSFFTKVYNFPCNIYTDYRNSNNRSIWDDRTHSSSCSSLIDIKDVLCRAHL